MPDSVKEPQSVAPWLAIAALVFAWVGLDFVVQIAREPAQSLWDSSSLRATVATRAILNVALLWMALAATKAILRACGQTFANIGWRRPAPRRAWFLALGLAVVYVGVVGATLGRDAELLSDWSVYRVSLAVVLGISAGVCTELIFRGFVMAQLRAAGLGVFAQVVLSSALFALALTRFGWAGVASPDFGALAAVAAGTAVLGAAFAGIYLIGGRSLMPVVVAHTLIDGALYPGVLLVASGA